MNGWRAEAIDATPRSPAISAPQIIEEFRQIQKLIYDDRPYTFLWHRPIMWAFNSRIRGVEFSPLGVTGFHPGPRAWWVPKETD
ncbi:MAG: hypothetical protein V3W34_17955 [Phycisphaerae bacterium]